MPRIKARRCLCGCREFTSGPRRLWVSGHNMRVSEARARMAELQRERMTDRRGSAHPSWLGTVEERFHRFVGPVDEETGCRPWQGNVGLNGYGTIRRGSRDDGVETVHRLAFRLGIRPLREGEVVHHVCQNRLCVNPAHLVALTASEHALLHAALRRELREAA